MCLTGHGLVDIDASVRGASVIALAPQRARSKLIGIPRHLFISHKTFVIDATARTNERDAVWARQELTGGQIAPLFTLFEPHLADCSPVALEETRHFIMWRIPCSTDRLLPMPPSQHPLTLRASSTYGFWL